MMQTVYVRTPIKVSFVIRRDASGTYVGFLKEFPGIISQGRTRDGVKRSLVRVLREVSREHPEELRLFR